MSAWKSLNFCQSKCYTLRQNFDCEKVSQHVEVYHADSSRGPIRWQQMDGYGKFHFLPFFTLAPVWTVTLLFNLIKQNVLPFFLPAPTVLFRCSWARTRRSLGRRFDHSELGKFRNLGADLLSNAQPQFWNWRWSNGTFAVAITERRTGGSSTKGNDGQLFLH